MSLPLLPSLLVSALLLTLFVGGIWVAQKRVWSSPVSRLLPSTMVEGMPHAHAQQVVAFLVTTLALLVLAGLGFSIPQWFQWTSVGTEVSGAVVIALLVGSALSLIILATLARWRNPRFWLSLSGGMQALGVAMVWSLAALNGMGWGVTISQGPSMEPSLPADPSLGLVDLHAYKDNPPLVGDIVTFRGTDGWASGAYNKRVVGVAGDAFQYAFDQVWKNGDPLVHCSSLGCFASPSTGVMYQVRGSAWVLPKGWGLKKASVVADDHFFVLGDNLAISGDSRFFGAIPRHALEGRVVAVIGIKGFQKVDGT